MRPFDQAAALSMGGATGAYSETGIAWSNEAQLGLSGRFAAYAGSALPYGIADWNVYALQARYNVSKYDGIGLSLQQSGTDDYREQQYAASYGRALGKKFFMGASLQFLQINQQEYGNASGVTFGVGILAHALPTLWLGCRVQNPLQQDIGGEVLPTQFNVAASWRPSPLFSLSGETEKILNRQASVKFGVEYRPASVLVIRLGARSAPARVGFGAGLRLANGLGLDIGSEWHPALGMTPAAGVVWHK